MADFCNQCAKELGFDEGDLAGLSTAKDTREQRYAAVICEGCGLIHVDHTGRCVSDCIEHHNYTP